MEVFVSIAAFYPGPEAGPAIIAFDKNEKFEVLEANDTNRRHRTWWGVRRLRDGVLGYVQTTFLQFAETVPEQALPPNHQADRERLLRELDTMQQEDDPPLPDIYKVPPVQVQSIDDWAAAGDDNDNHDSTSNGSTSNLPSTTDRPSTPDSQNTQSPGAVLRPKPEKNKSTKTRKSLIDRLFGPKKSKEKKREKVQKSKPDQLNEEEASAEVPSEEHRSHREDAEEQDEDRRHRHHKHSKHQKRKDHQDIEPKETKSHKGKESKQKSHKEKKHKHHSSDELHTGSGEMSEEDVEDKLKVEPGEELQENEPSSGGEEEEEKKEGFGARGFPVQDYSDEDPDNNNRSLSEDEWKRLVDDVENDMNYPDPPEPEVDYPHDDNDENDVPNGSPLLGSPTRIIQAASGSLDDLPKYLKPASSTEDLIEPRKLPNPVIASKVHQDLHREMKHNQKLGIDPLKKKTELKREFERREEIQKRREKEESEKKKVTEMEKRLQEQKNKSKLKPAYEPPEKPEPEKPVEKKKVGGDAGLAEFQRIRSKIYSNIPNNEKS